MMKMGLKHFFFFSLSPSFLSVSKPIVQQVLSLEFTTNQLLATLKESAGMQRISNQRKR